MIVPVLFYFNIYLAEINHAMILWCVCISFQIFEEL